MSPTHVHGSFMFLLFLIGYAIHHVYVLIFANDLFQVINKSFEVHSASMSTRTRKDPKQTICVIDEATNPAMYLTSSFLDQCTLLKTTEATADDIRAFFPDWKWTRRIEEEGFTTILTKDTNLTWLSDWWRSRQSISFPNLPVPCKDSVLARQMSYFLGSQTFKDLRAVMHTEGPLYRHLNASNNRYLDNLERNQDKSLAMARLRSCFIDERERDGNAMHCAFLPTTDCILPAEHPIQDSRLQTPLKASREDTLCPDSGLDRRGCLDDQLSRPVPVHPQLKGGLLPDVSHMALFLFGRMMETAAPLRAAVEEVMADTIASMTFPCVAIHVRRGDKMGECARGRQSSCAFHKNWIDYADAAVGFLGQLDASINNNSGSLFVMTDDAKFLEDKTVEDGYGVFGMAGTTPPDLRNADGLRDLVILLASLEVGSMCDAVVGNSESEVTELLVLMNCLRRGVCPSVHSMNGRPLQAFEEYVVDGRASTVIKIDD
jgi:hypothetical protein